MKYVIATLDKPHYLWQMLVQMNNFRKLGIEKDAHFIIGCHVSGEPSDILMKIIQDESFQCSISLYTDDRYMMNYASTLRLHILAKHFDCNPELTKETFMYLDPDVIFTEAYDWSEFEKGDTWYVSDTRSYLDSIYIKSKSEQLFQEMCDIVGIDPILVEENDINAGGAQYIMKNVDGDFWRKCERQSEDLYNHMKSTEHIYHPEHPIQSWTADMWVVFWNGLMRTKVEIAPEMEFCWASDMIEKWEKCIIFHAAGVVGNDTFHFSKGMYQHSPFNADIQCNINSASSKYVEEIRETKKNFPHLIW